MDQTFARIALLTFLALLLAGCDKCGHGIKLITPSLPNACGDNADPGRG